MSESHSLTFFDLDYAESRDKIGEFISDLQASERAALELTDRLNVSGGGGGHMRPGPAAR